MSTFYFDNNATTRVLPTVLEAMLPWFSEQYGNASSSHHLGQHAKAALVAARAAVAAFVGASPAEIVFTSGATEANHMAILGALAADPTRQRIVTSVVEHSSTLCLLAHLAAQGVEVVQVPVQPGGELDMAALADAVTDDTALVTLMHANNETGVLFPVAAAAAIAHARGAAFHTDAAQTAGKIRIDVRQIGCDLLSFSGHKLHAPKGVGVLYVRKGFALEPLIYGHQERNRRGGTENQAGIVGLGVACRLAQEYLVHHAGRVDALRDRLQSGILARMPFARFNGSAARVPNTCSLSFPGLHGEELLHRLDQAGVIASQGSACTANGTEPSHVLLAMGLSRDEALSSVRFSLSRETTEAEVDIVVKTMAAVVEAMTAPTSVAA
ncbi:MAG TPA: aminotransferase class V-fold PLP-dependent enzyme [Novimethylophilus sp.]|jgi:cysteine desulfurase|uniref:cysteine desulfurase family protein n=1 Tax=Novimethylophilus sp. TaxID=2137426 RepID=UPI002F3F9184